MASFVVFYFLNLFIDHTIIVFILVVILAVCDFWTVKNVTGRILVGLRWWNEIQEDGSEVIRYETADLSEHNQHNVTDGIFFWGSQIIFLLLWTLISLYYIISIKPLWMLLSAVCLTLNFVNTIGYYKCRGGIQTFFKFLLTKYGFNSFLKKQK